MQLVLKCISLGFKVRGSFAAFFAGEEYVSGILSLLELLAFH